MRNNLAGTIGLVLMSALSLLAQPGQGTRFVGVAGPTMLTEPGQYMLTTGVMIGSTGNGIQITGSNITLDLNGQTISGSGSGVGVRVSGARNVVIRNGVIDGAMMGIVTMNASNVRIENVQIRGRMAAPPEAGIMMVQTTNSIVRSNQIWNTALGIFVRGGGTFGNLIEGNTISTANVSAPFGICYNPADNDPEGPKGDRVAGNVIRGFQQALQFSATSEYNVAEGNTFLYRAMAFTSMNDTNVVESNRAVRIR